ncbi:hypothetical protein, partial [Pseudomonas sp. PNPG3]|uniref:hypothetical protein n=1 Tax=Pseudomonas sp. PNPG3 TaxID=2919497 RepID=UPI001FFD1B98
SDTWDLWQVIGEILPALKERIMGRDGRLVIRPDSGNPVDILCGTVREAGAGADGPEAGVVETLWREFGGSVTAQGFKVLDPHI